MLTVVTSKENTGIISIPADEMEKLGINDGDEVEFSKNENDEIVLHAKMNARKAKILKATREIIENRKSALLELGK